MAVRRYFHEKSDYLYKFIGRILKISLFQLINVYNNYLKEKLIINCIFPLFLILFIDLLCKDIY